MTIRNKEKRKIVNANRELTAITDNIIKQNDFYQYKPATPTLLNKEKWQNLIDMINDRTNNLVIGDNQLKEYTGRNNILAKLRKVANTLKSTKTDVHREAKQAYADFDRDVDDLLDQLTPAIDNLSEQVNHLREQEKEEKINKLENIFNNLVENYFENNNSNNNYPKAVLAFDNWFENSALRASQKKNKQDMTAYITNQIKTFDQYMQLINNDKQSQLLSKVFLDNYDGNAEDAYFAAQQKAQEVAELAKYQQPVNDNNEVVSNQTATENNDTVNNENNNIDQDISTEKHPYYFFCVNNPADAKKIKDFVENNNIKYVYKEKLI